MTKSNIVFQIEYKTGSNKGKAIGKWMDYATQKNKADSSSIDEYNLLKDYAVASDKKTFLNEYNETYLWNKDGDILKKDVMSELKNVNSKGIFWRGFLSFPSDFAMEHGLITKTDFYSLTNNIFPTLITDMGLDLNNVNWMCTLHLDTPKHPHIHFCIYEKVPTRRNPIVPRSAIANFKSNVANYLIDNKEFYRLRDSTFSKITGSISNKEFSKIKSQRLFSDKYRKGLNNRLLELYDVLPKTGRLQYNSKNMKPYKEQLDRIIHYILMHDSVKYDYANYLRLLEQHQKELNQLYGNSKNNQERKYYNDQLNKLYSKIGNEILHNYKVYQSMDFMDREREFLKKHINELNFKSRNDYAKEETKIGIAKDLYKICMVAGLNETQTKKVFVRWLKNSKYKMDADSLIASATTLDSEMTTKEYYDALKKLGYSSDRFNKFKTKHFYRELDYKKFINKAINNLMYEIDNEEKQIVENIQYELESGFDK